MTTTRNETTSATTSVRRQRSQHAVPVSAWYAIAGVIAYTTITLLYSVGALPPSAALAFGWLPIWLLLIAAMRHGVEVLEICSRSQREGEEGGAP